MTYTDKIKDNFDINIYNRAQHENPGGPDNEWVLCPYSLEWDGEYYNRVTELSQFNLTLTEEEANILTLGWGPDLGGDYCEDEDFWIDCTTFLSIYKNIPDTVSVWIDFVTYNL
jgi:hypothetical protein